MSRGLTDDITSTSINDDENNAAEAVEIVYEMQDVVQKLIEKHNELYDKVEKLEEKLTDLRIQHEAAKLVWQKGL
jgi:hypothetical protein